MTADNSHATLESPNATIDSEISPLSGAYFPRKWITDFFTFVHEHPKLEFITYSDFPWGDDSNYREFYPEERKRWQKSLKSGERDINKAYILLQYDVDSRPERTLGLLRAPEHQSVPANVMLFNKRVDRRRLKNTGVLGFTDYEIDEAYLRECQARGCIIGYHMNTYEQALFDDEKALEIFDRDVKELSQKYDLKFFSAHGGVVGPDGRNNRDVQFHPAWADQLKWVHNGHSPFFDRQFSDGGHNSPKRDPEKRDLRDFVRSIRPGERCRILLHPQYYDVNPVTSPRFGETKWYLDLIEAYRSGEKRSLWSDVEIDSAANAPTAQIVETAQPTAAQKKNAPPNVLQRALNALKRILQK